METRDNGENYEERLHELFGVLVSSCDGDTKLILRGMEDSGKPTDGYKALIVFQHRFDTKT